MQFSRSSEPENHDAERAALRTRIIASLLAQGYEEEDGRFRLVDTLEKDNVRNANRLAVAHKRTVAARTLARREDDLLSCIANGSDVKPECIDPQIITVTARSREERIFRYVACHWSIPVSAGYGRRLRFLITDRSNDKVIGILGLGDPVYAMRGRDQLIGWSTEDKKTHLRGVLDAFVMGAVPPYSQLLCGKLVAMLALSNEVREAFRSKYAGHASLIGKSSIPPELALITTASALGRSSVYNRLRIGADKFWESVGYTQGSGEFHFTNGVYDEMRRFAATWCQPTAKHAMWGAGFRNRREVVRKCLIELDLPRSLVYHGIKREVFAAKLGENAFSFLKGEASALVGYDRPAKHLAELFRERWLLKRATVRPDFRKYNRTEYRLFGDS